RVYARLRSRNGHSRARFLVSSRRAPAARLDQTMRSRLRAERGQTSVEYLGMIVVVAVILAGLAAASPTVGNVVGAGLRRAVCLISRSGSCPDAPSRGGLGSSPIDARPTRAEPT